MTSRWLGVQGVQPPPPLELWVDFCGLGRLCPGVAGKVVSTPPRPCFGLVRSGGAQRPEPLALLLGSEPSWLWQEVSTGPEELVPCGGGGSLALGETGSG